MYFHSQLATLIIGQQLTAEVDEYSVHMLSPYGARHAGTVSDDCQMRQHLCNGLVRCCSCKIPRGCLNVSR